MKYFFFASILIIALGMGENVPAQWSQATGLSALHIKCLATFGENLYAGGNNVFRSTDNGISWNSPIYIQHGSGIYALAKIDTIIFAGTDGKGISRSIDSGINWTKVNNGLKDLYVWGITIIGTSVYVLPQFGGIFRSEDYGEKWIESDSGLPTPSGNLI